MIIILFLVIGYVLLCLFKVIDFKERGELVKFFQFIMVIGVSIFILSSFLNLTGLGKESIVGKTSEKIVGLNKNNFVKLNSYRGTKTYIYFTPTLKGGINENTITSDSVVFFQEERSDGELIKYEVERKISNFYLNLILFDIGNRYYKYEFHIPKNTIN